MFLNPIFTVGKQESNYNSIFTTNLFSKVEFKLMYHKSKEMSSFLCSLFEDGTTLLQCILMQ